MEFNQGFSIFLFATVFYTWLTKYESLRRVAYLVDMDKFNRRNILDKLFFYYSLAVGLLIGILQYADELQQLIYYYFEKPLTLNSITIGLTLAYIMLFFILRRYTKYTQNNKKIVALPYSNYSVPAKKRAIGYVKGSFLENEKESFMNFTIRADDYTIQDTSFNKMGIDFKLAYIKNNMKKNRFTSYDFEIIEAIENKICEIYAENEIEIPFEKKERMKDKIEQIIKLLQKSKKFAFSFGQVIQHSETLMIDELITFFQEIQENKYSSNSLPYLLYFKDIVK